MMKVVTVNVLLILASLLLFSGCGGSNSGGGNNVPPVNGAPDGNVTPEPTPTPTPSPTPTPTPLVEAQVETFSEFSIGVSLTLSPEAFNCGIISINELGSNDDQLARQCLLDALENVGESFAVFELQGIDSSVGVGFTVDASNQVSRFRFDNAALQTNSPTVTRSMCPNPILVAPGTSSNIFRCDPEPSLFSLDDFVEFEQARRSDNLLIAVSRHLRRAQLITMTTLEIV